MKIAGIIAEYNPFHNGHAHHVRETRRLIGCDYVVACMDGHFTQRGEPTMFSKWNRARMALSSGVDAVFELPALWAVRNAEAFARGGVAILGGLGVDALSFGCESDDVGMLEALADIHENEPKSVSESIQRGLDRGETHARARGNAIAEYLNLPPALLNSPNLILAVEYLRAIRLTNCAMEPVVVKRIGGYHEADLGEYASASAIRAAVERKETEVLKRCLPPEAQPFAEVEALHPMDDLLLYKLRNLSPEELSHLPDMSEGLENRLYRLCRETGTREALLNALKCKRYTHARLSRMLTHTLLGFAREMVEEHPQPNCARLIGLRRGAEPLLGELKRRASIPIIAAAPALKNDPVFDLECRATDIWALLHDDPSKRLPGRELTERFVRI